MKIRFLTLFIICALVLSLVGCYKGSNGIETVKRTEDETKARDLYPSVPDELEGSYFLYSKNRGKCRELVGKVQVLASRDYFRHNSLSVILMI